MCPKNLKIKGKIITVPTENGKELHPLVLQKIYEFAWNSCTYIIPACGGMDDHLASITFALQKKAFSLENHNNRAAIDINTISKAIDKECSVWYGIAYFSKEKFLEKFEEKDKNISRVFLEKLLGKNEEFFQSSLWLDYERWCERKRRRKNGKIANTHTITHLMLASFYSKELIIDNEPSVVERNSLWVQKLIKLNEEKFKLAFAHVGLGHLHDLFEKLKGVGFIVSDRLALDKLDEILLDDDCVLAEHAARKAAMKAAFGITHQPKYETKAADKSGFAQSVAPKNLPNS